MYRPLGRSVVLLFVFFLLVLDTLKPAAWIPLLPLAYTVWIASSNLLFRLGGYLD
jgi:hypothetical protein